MLRFSALAAPLILAAGLAFDVDTTVDLKEWTVPWDGTRPRDPFVDQKGRVWFVGQQGNYVAYLTPKTGKFERLEVPKGTHPHNLVVDDSGMVWLTGNRTGTLLKIDPATRKTMVIAIPDSTVRDPHTMVIDRSGIVWFTAQQADAVVRFDPKANTFRVWRTGARSRPYGIIVGRDDMIWLDLFGTNVIASIDPATMRLVRHALPNPESRPRRIDMTSDGAVWYTDYTRGMLGRLDPTTGSVEEVALPGGNQSLPYAMAVDHQDRVWVAETGVRPNRLVSVDAKQRVVLDTVPLGGGETPNTIRHMIFHEPGKELWFGTDRNTIGRLRLE